jgi:hypothetical protein
LGAAAASVDGGEFCREHASRTGKRGMKTANRKWKMGKL